MNLGPGTPLTVALAFDASRARLPVARVAFADPATEITSPSDLTAYLLPGLSGAGADCLKIFPGELATAAYVKAITAVLPKSTRLLLVGGVSVENIAAWKQSAIAGFGIGSSLFKPGDTATAVEAKARAMIAAYRG